MDLKQAIANAVKKFKDISTKDVGIISHNDSDGLCSAAIMFKALERANYKVDLNYLTRSESDAVDIIKNKKQKLWFLLDYGGKEVHWFTKTYPEEFFIVLDHHKAEDQPKPNVININPHFYNVDGGKDCCGASLCFLFAYKLSKKNLDLITLALTGAIGDSQYLKAEFTGVNKELEILALKNKLIDLKKGLKTYGWSARPIHRALEYSIEPNIPGITGSESSAVQFLNELRIPIQDKEGNWRTMMDLSEDEKMRLANAILLKRHKLKDASNIFETNVFLPNFPIKELREASVLSATLNSCAKLDAFSQATKIALGDKASYDESKDLIITYQQALVKGVQLYFDNEKNPSIVRKTKKAIYFFAMDQLKAELASTVSTMLSYNLSDKGIPIFIFATVNEKRVKVSCRVIKSSDSKNDIDLGSIVSKVASKLGGEGGGHKMASGANIPVNKIDEFIQLVESLL